MIKAENLSYSFPHKELYNKISFTLEDDVHCAFIGTNGTGKSTLVNMILHPDKYLYDGKLIVDVPGRIGYVSQFYTIEREKEVTVFDYISEEFVRLQNKINQICEDMAVTDHLEELMEEYQQTLDEFNAIDGDFYESNIRKQLKTAGLAGYEDQLLTNLSGGEFKLVQAIREMMISPKFIIMDEPDVFKTIDTIIQRGYFKSGHVVQVLYGSNDLFNWHTVWSSTDKYMRGFRGTPYKAFRIALICTT